MLLLPRARSRYVLDHVVHRIRTYLQKHIDNSHASHLSSDSDFVESNQSEGDDGRSADPEEWHGFQDMTFEKGTNVDHVSSSDHRPTHVQLSFGMSKFLSNAHYF